MQILVVAGFLGSGKTTAILALAGACADGGRRRVAILENEVGRHGIDGDILRAAGLDVTDLPAGCICCDLAGDLLGTVQGLAAMDEAPDLLIIEPSGVAAPQMVLRSLEGLGDIITASAVLLLIDARRFASLERLALPFVEASLAAADAVLVTKADLVDDAHLRELLTRLPGRLPAQAVALTQGQGLDAAAELVLGLLAGTDGSRDLVSGDLGGVSIAPVSQRFDLDHLGGAECDELLCALVDAVRSTIVRRCPEAIGHIKAIASGRGGQRYVQCAAFDAQPLLDGSTAPGWQADHLIINAIVCGIERDQLAAIVADSFPLLPQAAHDGQGDIE